MNQKTFLVVAAVVSTTDVILYSPTGDTLTIKQGDQRVPGIIEALKAQTPTLQSPVEVSIEQPQLVNTAFDQFGMKTEEIFQFFRVAKTFLDGLFAQEAAAHQASTPLVPHTFGSTNVLDEIMLHAKPVGTAMDDSTVVAVVGGEVIAGVENMTEQIKYANENGTKGMEAFFKRLAAVASKRRHSAQDLMKFLQRADLPIAEDGCIIAYKNLDRGNGADFVDKHTRLVQQRVGDFVCMDESLVDPSRREACSNGLHIASRSYLNGFSGAGTFLCKIAPEDVIAVPEYDQTKMRVCGYHILLQLPTEIAVLVNANKPMTDSEAAGQMLGKAMAGHHIPRLREVKIGGHRGTNITYTVLAKQDRPVHPKDRVKVPVKAAKVLDDSKDTETAAAKSAKKIDPASLVQNSGTSARVQTAMKLMALMQKARSKKAAREAAQSLKDFKKKAKVGWDRLGISETEVALIEQAVSQ